MANRLQTINGDTVLEITSTTPVKVRLSENELLHRKAILEEAITRFQSELADTEAKLGTIHAERTKVGR